MSERKTKIILSVIIIAIVASLLVVFAPRFFQPAPALTLACPVPREFCNKGKIIKQNGKLIGLGFELPVNASLFSAASGTIREGIQQGENTPPHPILLLRGQGELEDYIIFYNFFGTSDIGSTSLKETQVEEGRVVGYTGVYRFPQESYQGVNFIISIRKGDVTNPPVSFDNIKFK